MALCDNCFLKGTLCAHIRQLQKQALKNTVIDGEKLCPILLAAGTPEKEEKEKRGVPA